MIRFSRISGVTLLALTLLWSCTSEKSRLNTDRLPDNVVRYATGFNIIREGGVTKLIINRPYQNSFQQIEYWLVPPGFKQEPRDPTVQTIEVPVSTIICTSTTHIPLLDYLGLSDRLVGFPNPDYISSQAMRQRIEAGHVRNVGLQQGLNYEVLAELTPSVLMSFQLNADFGQMSRIREMGIPVVVNAEYLEEHPLGRAEWIRVMGMLFAREQKADSVFREVERNYLKALENVKGITLHPTVLSGTLYGSTWFLPGGRNHVARLFGDAGLTYLWNDTRETGSLELGFESVYEKANNADLWIGAASFGSLQQMDQADRRYSQFRPFREGRVYTYTGRIGPTGGNEYLELGYLRPDIILMDLIAIAHPEISKGYSLYFFRKLE